MSRNKKMFLVLFALMMLVLSQVACFDDQRDALEGSPIEGALGYNLLYESLIISS